MSHNPRTDHTSLYILCAVAGIIGLAILSTTLGHTNAGKPRKEFTIDGCDIYSFRAKDNSTAYFARCNNGKVATTFGKESITTETK